MMVDKLLKQPSIMKEMGLSVRQEEAPNHMSKHQSLMGQRRPDKDDQDKENH